MAEYNNNKTKTLRPSLDHGILLDFEWHPKKDVKDTNYDDIEVALTNVNGDDFQSGQDKIKVLDLPLLGGKKTWKTGKCLLFRHVLRSLLHGHVSNAERLLHHLALSSSLKT